LNFLHRSFVRIQLDLVSDPEGLRPQKKQAGEEILQYVWKTRNQSQRPDTQDLDEIGHLEGGSNDGDSYQEAEQYRSAAGQSRKHKRKILTPLKDGFADDPSGKTTQNIKTNENRDRQNQ
jgi:hypothetical protein